MPAQGTAANSVGSSGGASKHRQGSHDRMRPLPGCQAWQFDRGNGRRYRYDACAKATFWEDGTLRSPGPVRFTA